MITMLKDVEVEEISGGQDYLIHNKGNPEGVSVSAADQTLPVFIKVLGKIGNIPGIDVEPIF